MSSRDCRESLSTLLELVRQDKFYELTRRYIHQEQIKKSDKISLKYYLQQYLNVPDQTVVPVPGEYTRDSLLVEIIHETMLYGVNRGLNERDISSLVSIVINALMTMISRDTLTPTELLKELQVILHHLSPSLSKHGLVSTAHYLSNTILQHAYLYHFLLTENQEVDRELVRKTVHPSTDVLELSEGCLEEEWLRKEKLLLVTNDYEKHKNELGLLKEQVKIEGEIKLEGLYEGMMDRFESEDQLHQTVDAIVKGHVANAESDLIHKLKEEEIEMSYNIDKVDILSPRKKHLSTSPEKSRDPSVIASRNHSPQKAQ